MSLARNVPKDIRDVYEVHEWRNASAILKSEYRAEWKDVMDVLRGFKLKRSDILTKGGKKSPVANALDEQFYDRGWEEKRFATSIKVDEDEYPSPTHKVDCFKGGVAVEVEWNNKDPFYDRDLNNFRLLFELRAIGVGVLITRSTALQEIFKDLGKARSYGPSTTHMGKLLPKVEGGGAGGCPVLAFGISRDLYVED